jgi:hypothetical protein
LYGKCSGRQWDKVEVKWMNDSRINTDCTGSPTVHRM